VERESVPAVNLHLPLSYTRPDRSAEGFRDADRAHDADCDSCFRHVPLVGSARVSRERRDGKRGTTKGTKAEKDKPVERDRREGLEGREAPREAAPRPLRCRVGVARSVLRPLAVRVFLRVLRVLRGGIAGRGTGDRLVVGAAGSASAVTARSPRRAPGERAEARTVLPKRPAPAIVPAPGREAIDGARPMPSFGRAAREMRS
jgi:hypothetical protein